jgi:hypothetical protein
VWRTTWGSSSTTASISKNNSGRSRVVYRDTKIGE